MPFKEVASMLRVILIGGALVIAAIIIVLVLSCCHMYTPLPGYRVGPTEVFLWNPGLTTDQFVTYAFTYITKNYDNTFNDIVFLYDEEKNVHGVIIVLLR